MQPIESSSSERLFDFPIPEFFAGSCSRRSVPVGTQQHLRCYKYLMYYNRRTHGRFVALTFIFKVPNDRFQHCCRRSRLPHPGDLLLLSKQIEIWECFYDSKGPIRTYQQQTWKGGVISVLSVWKNDQGLAVTGFFFHSLQGNVIFYHRHCIFIHS